MSSIASSTVAKPDARSVASIRRIVVSAAAESLRVLREQVDLDVEVVAGDGRCERGVLERERDEGDLDPVAAQRGDRQRDAVDGDRALLDAVAQELRLKPQRQARAFAFGLEPLDARRPV